MANVELAARLHCSYKRATFVLCAGNLVVALYLLQSVVGPFYFQTSSSSSSSNELQQQVGTGDHTAVAGALQQEVIYSEEDLKRQEESNDLRRAVLPVRLMERVSNKWAFAPSTEIQNHHAMCKEEEEEEEEETKPHSLWQRIFFSFLGFASREIKDCSVADFCWC
jgi:hypothetical protein